MMYNEKIYQSQEAYVLEADEDIDIHSLDSSNKILNLDTKY